MRVRIWAHPVYFQFPGDRGGQRRSAAEVSQRLAPVLNRSAAKLEQRLSGQVSSIRLLEHLSLEKGELVKALGISGIDVEIYPQRRYPQGELFASVVGFLNLERQPQAGLELSRNAQLWQGERSPWLLGVGTRAVLPVNLSMGAITDDAMQLHLSLDARLQRASYTALSAAMEQWTAARGAVMVMDAHNGELLALASQPSFDPSRFWQADPRHFRGWPVEDLYEPGSTFQPGADLVAVIPLVGHQGYGWGQILQQDSSTGAVAALSCAQVQPHRPPVPVTDHRSLAGQSLARYDRSSAVHAPFEAGRRAMGFDGGGIDTSTLPLSLCHGIVPPGRRSR